MTCRRTTQMAAASVVLCVLVGCSGTPSVPAIRTSSVVVGTEIDSEGHITDAISQITPHAKRVYIAFELEAPEESEVPLDFRWYYQSQLIYSVSKVHQSGSVLIWLERVPEKTPKFQTGHYRVDVWISNTLLFSVPFEVVD